MSECDPSQCDKQCKEHGETTLLVKQHGTRINALESVSVDVSNDVAKIEGRINTFIWALGLVFFVIISVAAYGSVQISRFKDVYMADSIVLNKTLSQISADLSHVKLDIARIERTQEKVRREERK